jgi:hypothetical protein
MNVRQKIQALSLVFFSLIAFASYHEGSTVWLQWLMLLVMLSFTLVFDLAFMNESQFIFDPDAENWRRKTEAASK